MQRELLAGLERSLANSLEGIRGTFRQTPSSAAADSDPVSTGEARCMKRGELIVDLAQHAVTLEGNPLDLSPTEFELLAYLVAEAPRVVSAQEMVRKVQGYDSEPDEAREIVRYHMYRIRQKAQAATGRADIVITVRGVGYRIGI